MVTHNISHLSYRITSTHTVHTHHDTNFVLVATHWQSDRPHSIILHLSWAIRNAVSSQSQVDKDQLDGHRIVTSQFDNRSVCLPLFSKIYTADRADLPSSVIYQIAAVVEVIPTTCNFLALSVSAHSISNRVTELPFPHSHFFQ